jgi:hypothetical protein
MQPQVKPFVVEKKKRRRALSQRQTEPATLMLAADSRPIVSTADRKPGPIGRLA